MPDIDLNLLRVFDALMETGSVSAASEQLHLSIPATSRALGRLRRAMDDPIMVRAGRGLVPTPFALRSAPRVRTLLNSAAELLRDSTDDDPMTWRRTFVIRIDDGLTPLGRTALGCKNSHRGPGYRAPIRLPELEKPRGAARRFGGPRHRCLRQRRPRPARGERGGRFLRRAGCREFDTGSRPATHGRPSVSLPAHLCVTTRARSRSARRPCRARSRPACQPHSSDLPRWLGPAHRTSSSPRRIRSTMRPGPTRMARSATPPANLSCSPDVPARAARSISVRRCRTHSDRRRHNMIGPIDRKSSPFRVTGSPSLPGR